MNDNLRHAARAFVTHMGSLKMQDGGHELAQTGHFQELQKAVNSSEVLVLEYFTHEFYGTPRDYATSKEFMRLWQCITGKKTLDKRDRQLIKDFLASVGINMEWKKVLPPTKEGEE